MSNLVLILIAIIYSVQCESKLVEQYIIDYFTKHRGDVGEGRVHLDWAKMEPLEIPAPERDDAYLIPVEFGEFTVQVLFYVDYDAFMAGEEEEREWTLEVAPVHWSTNHELATHPGASFITIKQFYKEVARKAVSDEKKTNGVIEWVYATTDADIKPFPRDTVKFLGCFWFELFGEFDVPKVTTTDAATVDNDSEKPLLFIRAFAGLPSIYIKKSIISHITTFKAQPPKTRGTEPEPWERLDYLALIKVIRVYKIDDIIKELEDAPGGTRRPDADTIKGIIGDYKKDATIGRLMTFLWYGKKGYKAGKDADTTNQGKWIKIFNLLHAVDDNSVAYVESWWDRVYRVIIPFNKYLNELQSRYVDMIMMKPTVGWKRVCTGKKKFPIIAKPTELSISRSIDPLEGIVGEVPGGRTGTGLVPATGPMGSAAQGVRPATAHQGYDNINELYAEFVYDKEVEKARRVKASKLLGIEKDHIEELVEEKRQKARKQREKAAIRRKKSMYLN